MLTERSGRQAFVWKNESVEATAKLLTIYDNVKKELAELLNEAG